MLGDDLNATVMTERFGFGAVFGRTQEGVGGCAERLRRQTNNRGMKLGWTGTTNEGKAVRGGQRGQGA